MSSHLIVKLPENWTNSDSETTFNSLGFEGWELLHIYNLHAYFMKHATVPLKYKFVKTDEYMSNFQTTLNDNGINNWIFVLMSNGYSVLKQIAIA
jgi:hypothetical protein